MNQRVASKPSRKGEQHWAILALALALLLVGHDLVMTSTRAHAASKSASSDHHQQRGLHVTGMTSIEGAGGTVSAPHGGSQCPASRVAKAPSSISASLQAHVAGGTTLIHMRTFTLSNVAIPVEPSSHVSAETRRALL